MVCEREQKQKTDPTWSISLEKRQRNNTYAVWCIGKRRHFPNGKEINSRRLGAEGCEEPGSLRAHSAVRKKCQGLVCAQLSTPHSTALNSAGMNHRQIEQKERKNGQVTGNEG